jgi:ubiquitin carboxyl-terminal hydrolase 10
LPWTPAKASALFNQKVSQQSQIQLQDAQHQSHAGDISSSDPSSLSSAAKATPSSWSALLKSSQTGSSDAANPSPFISKSKKNQANINTRNQTSHIEKWRIVNTSQKGPPIVPRGLINNGNTCFMNSILQPLLHTPPFYLFLMGLYQRGGIVPTPNVKTRVLDSMYVFLINSFYFKDDFCKRVSKFI